jgi:hypothetical protein
MLKRRIRGIKKRIYCPDCNIIKEIYIAIKGKLYQCKCCNEMYVATEMDLTYGNIESVLKNKNCSNCKKSLENFLLDYKFAYECNDCNEKCEILNEERDVLLGFYDLFS